MAKRNPNNYRVPQIGRDKRYIKFQSSPGPRLPQTSLELLAHKPKCDTILGGKRIWLRGQRRNNESYMYPIIVDGTRCSAEANRTFRENGRNIRRCHQHDKADFWIKDAIPDEEYFAK